MDNGARIGLDNSAFSGRLRKPALSNVVEEDPIKAEDHKPSQKFFNNDIGTIASTTPPREEPDPPPVVKIHNRTQPSKRPQPIHKTPAHEAPQPADLSPANYLDQLAESEPELTQEPVDLPPMQVVKAQPFAKPAKHKQDKSKVLARHSVKKPFMTSLNEARKEWTPLQMGIIGLAGAVFLIGIIVSISTMRSNSQAQAQLAILAQNASKSQKVNVEGVLGASTNPAANIDVAPDQPKVIKIPAIKADALVEPISMSSPTSLASASDNRNVAWNISSAKPDDMTNAVVINGSNAKTKVPSVFAKLNKISIGDQVTLVRGDNHVYTYRVVKTLTYDPTKTEVTTLLAPNTPGRQTLNLVTNGLVVYTELQS